MINAIAAPAAGREWAARPDAGTLKALAVEFETVFLTEMLRHGGLGKMSAHFNGGVGEDAFAGFLVREQAAQMARSGATGLSDTIQAAMARRVGP